MLKGVGWKYKCPGEGRIVKEPDKADKRILRPSSAAVLEPWRKYKLEVAFCREGGDIFHALKLRRCPLTQSLEAREHLLEFRQHKQVCFKTVTEFALIQ